MNTSKPDLWVVMPVYNEQESLRDSVEEWLACFRAHGLDFQLCVINDGSTDNSLSIIRELESVNIEVVAVDKENTGHGRTCMAGYQMALSRGARYVFQIDSDGQCDPRDFPPLWQRKNTCPAVFGRRTRRKDGIVRGSISFLLRLEVLLCTGAHVPDANVPYRLIQAKAIEETLRLVPADADLVNVFLAVVLQHQNRICWVDIGFRKRSGGSSATGLFALARKSAVLMTQLRRLRPRLSRAAE